MRSLKQVKKNQPEKDAVKTKRVSYALVRRFKRACEEVCLDQILQDEGWSCAEITAHKEKLLQKIGTAPKAASLLSVPESVEALSAFWRARETQEGPTSAEIRKGPLSVSFQNQVSRAWAAYPPHLVRFLNEGDFKLCAVPTISSYILDESSLFFEAHYSSERLESIDENFGYYEFFVKCAIVPEFCRLPVARGLCAPGVLPQEKDILEGHWFAAGGVAHTVRHESAHGVDCNVEWYIGNAVSKSSEFRAAMKQDLAEKSLKKEKEFYVKLNPRERALELWADHLAAQTALASRASFRARVWPHTYEVVGAFNRDFRCAESKGLSALMLFLKTKALPNNSSDFLFHYRWLDLLRRSPRAQASDVFLWMQDAGPSKVSDCLSRVEKIPQNRPNDSSILCAFQNEQMPLPEPLRMKAACALSAKAPEARA